ncbi:MAG: hypothetical protein O8C61_00860 [Candidatus Methanoperedens sp.]|nr:hypothetical protein [Candidatus Methanoperedens sp.]
MVRIYKLISILIIIISIVFPVFGQEMHGKAGDMMKKGVEMRSFAGMEGMGFMQSAGNLFGHYVTFTMDNSTGMVTDYGISGSTIFNSIKVAGFNLNESRTTGAVTTITGTDGSVVFELHDNPASVIKIKTKETANITFNLAEGVNASKENNTIWIEVNNLTAFIAAQNAASIEIAGRKINIGSSKGNIIFRAQPVNLPMNGRPQERMIEIMNNRAGAEISAGSNGTMSIINYSDNISLDVRSMGKNRMRFTIDSTDHSGKFIMMNLDNSSLTWNASQKIHVYLDGKPIRQVMSADMLYMANRSSFWLTAPFLNRMQGIIYISNFSQRTVDLVVEDAKPMMMAAATNVTTTVETNVTTTAQQPARTPGFEIGIGLIGIYVSYIKRRRG